MASPDPSPVAIPEQTQALVSTVDEMVSEARAVVVDSPATAQAAALLLTTIAGRKKSLTEKRMELTRPLDEAKRRTIDFFRAPISKLEGAEQTVKGHIAHYSEEQERIAARARAEEEERQRKEAARLQDRAAKAEEKGHTEKAEVLREQAEFAPPPAAPAAPRMDGVHTREVWHAEVVDFGALFEAAISAPYLRTFLEPGMKALNALARQQKGAMAVPGVKAVKETSVAARGRTF